MEINKDNVVEEVTKLLKSKKIPFTYEDEVFELMVGSESCYMQIETLGTREQGYDVVMQFYDNPENPMYEESEDINNIDETKLAIDQIESAIDQMMMFMKDKIKKITKILFHINAIKSICEEMDIDPEIFIDVAYDFSEYED